MVADSNFHKREKEMKNKADDSFYWLDGRAFLIVVYFYIRPVDWLKKVLRIEKQN